VEQFVQRADMAAMHFVWIVSLFIAVLEQQVFVLQVVVVLAVDGFVIMLVLTMLYQQKQLAATLTHLADFLVLALLFVLIIFVIIFFTLGLVQEFILSAAL
jgi:hypothetical protein